MNSCKSRLIGSNGEMVDTTQTANSKPYYSHFSYTETERERERESARVCVVVYVYVFLCVLSTNICD